ncbi:unnamed protein product [Prunus armeniaca]|uniref:Uncharacterized protein n=1 Tax=Prunus armeniaca TaxID=36596 RepID=A0A6J5WEY1_PRUAR|nr:unnamed protein product [Prunus armeniaca]CAB4300320.1 unnamed protein product [Prunus armeniaca]
MQVGYIVMIDPSTRARTNLLRMKGAVVVGVYHPSIDERKKKVYAWTVDDDMDFMQEMLSEHVDAIVTSKATPRSNARYQNTQSGALFLIIRRKKFVQPSYPLILPLI